MLLYTVKKYTFIFCSFVLMAPLRITVNIHLAFIQIFESKYYLAQSRSFFFFFKLSKLCSFTHCSAPSQADIVPPGVSHLKLWYPNFEYGAHFSQHLSQLALFLILMLCTFTSDFIAAGKIIIPRLFVVAVRDFLGYDYVKVLLFFFFP